MYGLTYPCNICPTIVPHQPHFNIPNNYPCHICLTIVPHQPNFNIPMPYLLNNNNNNNKYNSFTSFCLRIVIVVGQSFRSISSQVDLQLSERFFLVTFTLSSSTFYYETDHIKYEITFGGRHCGLRRFKLGARFTWDSNPVL